MCLKQTIGAQLTNLRTLILARHGKAVGKPGEPDEARELNELGFRQALALGVALEHHKPDFVLSSPLKRARLTMAIANGGRNVVWDVPGLTCSTAPEDPIQVMWAELGNVPLAQYFKHNLSHHLTSWAKVALEAVTHTIEFRVGKTNTVLIGGHALLQNTLLWAIAEEIAQEDCWAAAGIETVEKMALETILGEGEAFVLTFPSHEAGVTTCEHLRPTVLP